jgi:tetratricopeptide (TPR) repeat protein
MFFSGCSRERGDLSKRELPEYFGVFAAGVGVRPQPLATSSERTGPDLPQTAVLVVHLPGLPHGGYPEEFIQLLDRVSIRHEVEQVKTKQDGPVIDTRLHAPRQLFASFQKLPLRFRPAAKSGMLIAVPDEPLKPGLYVLRAGGEDYPFSVGIGNTPPLDNPMIRMVDRYFVTLDSRTGSPIDELFALSKRGLALGGNRNSIGDNAILDEFYRDTTALDLEMNERRESALAAVKSKNYMAAVDAGLVARDFFPDDKSLNDILQNAPKAAAESAMKNKQWQEANDWIARGRVIAPDKEKFEGFAGEAAFECGMGEARERFDAGDFEAATVAAQRASGIATSDRGRKEALDLAHHAKIEHFLAVARRAQKIGDIDSQFDAAINALGLEKNSTDARKLAFEARERMLSDPHYFGKYFRVFQRIKTDVDRFWAIAFTHDSKRLHVDFDTYPKRLFVAWDVESGRELARCDVDQNLNSEMNAGMLASLLDPRAPSSHSLRTGSQELVFKRFHTEEQVCAIPVEADVAAGKRFLSRSDRLLAVVPAADDACFVLVDPTRGQILHTLRLPFVSDLEPHQLKFGDQRLRVKSVAFGPNLDVVAASNRYGVGVFRVADGQMVFSQASKQIEYLLGVSQDGKEIAFAKKSLTGAGGDWYFWNLNNNSEPRVGQNQFQHWKIAPDLRLGFYENSGNIHAIELGKEDLLAEFDPPKPEEKTRFSLSFRSPQWDLSPDGRKLAIAFGGFIEIWSAQPPPLPEN